MNLPLDCSPPAANRRVGNRRITVRYRCSPSAAGTVTTSDDHEFQRAWIDNISTGGVGLFLSKPIAEGNFVSVHMKGALMAEVHERSGRVAHVTLREPFGWYVGIEFFEPITDDMLDSLL